MKLYTGVALLLICGVLTGCNVTQGRIGSADGPTSIVIAGKGEKAMYTQITPEDAKKIMDGGTKYIVLDVREADEFAKGHIPDAKLLPYTEIEDKAQEILPDKDLTVLVYCRSGRRSKIAAESLARLGYTDVKEFGGIIDWPYTVEK